MYDFNWFELFVNKEKLIVNKEKKCKQNEKINTVAFIIELYLVRVAYLAKWSSKLFYSCVSELFLTNYKTLIK